LPDDNDMDKTSNQTIHDFGQQWTRYTRNQGYYASAELFKDYCGALLSQSDIKGKRVLEIGSGTGRIVHMLAALGAKHVYAVEPSESFHVLQTNTQSIHEKVSCFHVSGENIPDIKADLAVSFGVLHHIPDPKPVVDRVYSVLPKGGKFIVWLYGYEGNEAYLSIFQPLRKITRVLPDFLLDFTANFFNLAMSVYIWLCRFFELPMKKYVTRVYNKMDWHSRKVIIFDQLNPQYAMYYRKEEAKALLQSSGFRNVRIHHRHHYSWTVLGEK
jgi:SAM-dependent methyltransferase